MPRKYFSIETVTVYAVYKTKYSQRSRPFAEFDTEEEAQEFLQEYEEGELVIEEEEREQMVEDCPPGDYD